jgi:ribosomal protein L9
MASLLSSVRSSATALRKPLISNIQTSTRRWGHTIRLIALEDLPHNKGYERDVIRVKAGYARNFLIPKKKAVYATPQNFERLGIVDPDVETAEQRTERLQRESSMNQKEELHLKEADLLKKYLRNKVVSS